MRGSCIEERRRFEGAQGGECNAGGGYWSPALKKYDDFRASGFENAMQGRTVKGCIEIFSALGEG